MGKNKIVIKLLAFIMLATMVFSMPVSLSALTDEEKAQILNPVIVKQLDMAEGIVTPDATFKFEIRAKGLNDNIDDSTGVPEIEEVSVRFTPADTGVKDPVTGIVSIEKHAPISISASDFPHAGIYIYSIKEVTGTYPGLGVPDKDKMLYDSSEYEMNVYVTNDGMGGLVISGIGIYKVASDGSKTKVDASDDGGELRFKNVYKKIAGSDSDPEYPIPDTELGYTSLSIHKTVEGDLADLTTEFDFAILFEKSATEDTIADFKYFIMDENGNVVSSGTTVAGALSFKLKHGQYIAFADIPAGTKYIALEKIATNYTSKVTLTHNDVTLSDLNYTYVDAENNETSLVINANYVTTPDTILGENLNQAKVTNTYKSVSITGIIVDNLPFVLLIIIGMGGFSYYAVSKKRKATR